MRVERVKEMSEEEQLLRKQRKRVGMSGSLRGEEVRRNDPIEYFPLGLKVPFESQKG